MRASCLEREDGPGTGLGEPELLRRMLAAYAHAMREAVRRAGEASGIGAQWMAGAEPASVEGWLAALVPVERWAAAHAAGRSYRVAEPGGGWRELRGEALLAICDDGEDVRARVGEGMERLWRRLSLGYSGIGGGQADVEAIMGPYDPSKERRTSPVEMLLAAMPPAVPPDEDVEGLAGWAHRAVGRMGRATKRWITGAHDADPSSAEQEAACREAAAIVAGARRDVRRAGGAHAPAAIRAAVAGASQRLEGLEVAHAPALERGDGGTVARDGTWPARIGRGENVQEVRLRVASDEAHGPVECDPHTHDGVIVQCTDGALRGVSAIWMGLADPEAGKHRVELTLRNDAGPSRHVLEVVRDPACVHFPQVRLDDVRVAAGEPWEVVFDEAQGGGGDVRYAPTRRPAGMKGWDAQRRRMWGRALPGEAGKIHTGCIATGADGSEAQQHVTIRVAPR